jgi:small subunit ribosomal protein S9
MKENSFYATGRRKTSVARVYLAPGTGKITVNNKDILEHFRRETHKMVIEQPLTVTNTLGKYDITAFVNGGGLSGQAGAVLLGIARALVKIDEDFRSALRKGGFLSRDPRMVERKKYGRAGARKRFQFSKR